MVGVRSLQEHPLPRRPVQRHSAPRAAFHLLCVSLLAMACRGSAFLLENAPPPCPPSCYRCVHDDHVHVHHHQPRAVITVSRGAHCSSHTSSHGSSSTSSSISHSSTSSSSTSTSSCSTRVSTQRPHQEPRTRLPTRPACFLAGATSGLWNHTPHKNNNNRRRTVSAPGSITLPMKKPHKNRNTGINTFKSLKNRGDIVVAFSVPPAHVGSAPRTPS
ncbi:unnamed protein product, partial [Laminaria digitata]